MSFMDKRDENTDLSSFRHGRRVDEAASTDAERYLVLGKTLVRLRRRGLPIGLFCQAMRVPVPDCHAAVQFAESAPATILRALVEEWPWLQIRQVVQREAREKPTDHIA